MFDLLLYTVTDSNNTLGKTLGDPFTVSGVRLKGSTDIKTPTISVRSDTSLFGYNYAYFPEFHRYYFIRTIRVFPAGVYEIDLAVDVLESFKDEILNSHAFVAQQTDINPYYGQEYESEVRKEIDVYNGDVKLNMTNKTNILVTIGG